MQRSRRNLEEIRGILRKTEEMSESVGFHARLATRGRVYIPKVVVERWVLWKETLIHIGDQEVGFESRITSWGRATSGGAEFCHPFFSRAGLTYFPIFIFLYSVVVNTFIYHASRFIRVAVLVVDPRDQTGELHVV